MTVDRKYIIIIFPLIHIYICWGIQKSMLPLGLLYKGASVKSQGASVKSQGLRVKPKCSLYSTIKSMKLVIPRCCMCLHFVDGSNLR